MKCIVPFVFASALGTSALSLSAYAQQAPASQQSAADTSDFTEGNLHFHNTGVGFIQVSDVKTKQMVGTIIVQGDAKKFVAMPGYDIEAAYNKHLNGDDQRPTEAAANSAAPVPATDGPTPPSTTKTNLGWDEASKTVTLSGGRSVTFTDDQNAKVVMPGPAGNITYDLQYHGATAHSLAHLWARGAQGNIGMSGKGVSITAESSNGMPGGLMYDTSEGANLGDIHQKGARLKPIVDTVREAAQVASGASHPELAKMSVIHTLLTNNLVR